MTRRLVVIVAVTLVSVALIMAIMVQKVGGQEDDPIRIVFMHHSTGYGLIWQGGVREAFTRLGYAFWDHDYNDPGLTGPDGEPVGENWDVPGDNTDVDGWHAIFAQDVTDPPENTFSHMLQYDVIIFKSCFPNSDIQSEEQLEAYQQAYLDIRDVIDAHPDKLFIAFTLPPLTPNSTSPEAAARAQEWAAWMISEAFLEDHPNLRVFDFQNLLADEEGYLRAEYRPEDEYDSHPNELANRTIGPLFVAFVDQAIRAFAPDAAPAIQSDEPETATFVSAPVDLIDDFEALDFDDVWWTYVNNEDLTEFTCRQVWPGHADSGHAMEIAFESEQWNTAGCGRDVEAGAAWGAADGVQFEWLSDPPSLPVNVVFWVADPAAPDTGGTPFQVTMETPDENWPWQLTPVRWTDLVKADWFGDEGLDAFDPANVRSIVFDVGSTEDRQGGEIVIDDLRLLFVEE